MMGMTLPHRRWRVKWVKTGGPEGRTVGHRGRDEAGSYRGPQDLGAPTGMPRRGPSLRRVPRPSTSQARPLSPPNIH